MAILIQSQQIIQALEALSSTDKDTQKKANEFLEDFQKKKDAWQISTTILTESNGSTSFPISAKIFASQTLRQKIQLDLVQLDQSARESLKDTLINYLKLISKQQPSIPKVLTTQLALCLVDLAIQVPSWTTTTLDFINMFNGPQQIGILLELLTLLPEEIMYNCLIPIEREQLISRSDTLLADPSERVFQFILNLFQQFADQPNELEMVMRCLLSWLKSGDIKVHSISQTPIISFTFSALQSENLMDVSVDTICEIIARSGGDLRRAKDNQDIITQVYSGLMTLLQSFPAIKKSIEENDDGFDRLKGICKIFVEAGESYCSLILENFEAFQGIIEAILQCAAVDDLDIVQITFNFWYIVCEDVCSSEFRHVKPLWKPVYQRLLDIMIKHVRYPDDLNVWTLTERDEFRDFRHVIGDVLKDCVQVLGEEEALSKPLMMLQSLSVQATTTESASFHADTQWQDIEAILFSLRTMGARISNKESRVLPQIMQLLDSLPEHPKVKYAAILVIGRYAEWTKHHPEFLTAQLNFISKGFEEPEAMSAAAQALKYLCESCGGLLVGHLNQLHPFYNQIIEKISISDRMQVTEALAHVIDAVPWQELLPILQGFCLPIANKLHDIANYSNQPVLSSEQQEGLVTTIQEYLSRFAVFMKHVRPAHVPLDTAHASVVLFQEMWPVFDQLLTNFGRYSNVAESFSKVVRAFIQSVGPHSRAVFPVLLNKIGTLYDQYRYAAYLWIATQCIKEFEESAESISELYSFVEILTQVTFQTFQAEKISGIPDLVDDFYSMINILMRKTPVDFISFSMTGPLLQAATQCCLETEDLQALLSVLAFLENFYGLMKHHQNKFSSSSSADNTVLKEYYATQISLLFNIQEQYWSSVFDMTLQGLFLHFPRDRDLMRGIAFIWMNISDRHFIDIENVDITNKKELYVSNLLQRLNQVLSGVCDDVLAKIEKEQFISKVKSSIISKDTKLLTTTLQEFSSCYRRRSLANSRQH